MSYTKDAIPEWLLDAQNPAVINAIAAAAPHGVPNIPAAPDYDSIALSATGEPDAVTPLEVDVIIDTTSARATQHIIDWGDSSPDSLLQTGDLAESHLYATPGSKTITVTNNAGQQDTFAVVADDTP